METKNPDSNLRLSQSSEEQEDIKPVLLTYQPLSTSAENLSQDKQNSTKKWSPGKYQKESNKMTRINRFYSFQVNGKMRTAKVPSNRTSRFAQF